MPTSVKVTTPKKKKNSATSSVTLNSSGKATVSVKKGPVTVKHDVKKKKK